MKKVLLGSIVLLLLCSLTGCGKTYVCQRCEKTTSKIYYDIDGEASWCKDCAKKYWAPFDYEKYRVKD